MSHLSVSSIFDRKKNIYSAHEKKGTWALNTKSNRLNMHKGQRFHFTEEQEHAFCRTRIDLMRWHLKAETNNKEIQKMIITETKQLCDAYFVQCKMGGKQETDEFG